MGLVIVLNAVLSGILMIALFGLIWRVGWRVAEPRVEGDEDLARVNRLRRLRKRSYPHSRRRVSNRG